MICKSFHIFKLVMINESHDIQLFPQLQQFEGKTFIFFSELSSAILYQEKTMTKLIELSLTTHVTTMYSDWLLGK